MPNRSVLSQAGTEEGGLWDERSNATIITSIALVEGEVLDFVAERGAVEMRGLIRNLDWPAHFCAMAVGSLLRQGLLRAGHRGANLIVAHSGVSY